MPTYLSVDLDRVPEVVSVLLLELFLELALVPEPQASLIPGIVLVLGTVMELELLLKEIQEQVQTSSPLI